MRGIVKTCLPGSPGSLYADICPEKEIKDGILGRSTDN